MAVVVPPATFIECTILTVIDVVVSVLGCKLHISDMKREFRMKLKKMLLVKVHGQNYARSVALSAKTKHASIKKVKDKWVWKQCIKKYCMFSNATEKNALSLRWKELL